MTEPVQTPHGVHLTAIIDGDQRPLSLTPTDCAAIVGVGQKRIMEQGPPPVGSAAIAPTCATCQFFCQTSQAKVKGCLLCAGDCRRHAPIVVPVGMSTRNAFPFVLSTASCGDHKGAGYP